MAEFSKWLEAGEESTFFLETEKTFQVHPYELPEAAARTKFPENIFFSDGLSSSGLAVRRYSEGG